MTDNYSHSELTAKLIKAYYKVYNTLGYGFLEKIYENAFMIELEKMGIAAKAQVPIKVFYEDRQIGYYVADIIAENRVIVELKAAESICEEHEAKLTNYLKATDLEVGLLLNFGKKPDLKRKVFSSDFKKFKKRY